MTEAEFWSRRIRRLLPLGCFATRIENGLSAGTPDVFYAWGGVQGWIENKYRPTAPVRDTTVVFPEGQRGSMRKEQRAWWIQYLAARGRGLIMAGVEGQSFMWHASPGLVMGFNKMVWGQVKEDGIPVNHNTLRFALLQT